MNDDQNVVPEEQDLGKKDEKKSSSKKKRDETEALKKRIEDLENQSRLNRDQLMRAVADYRNLEKRVDEEKREFVKFANRDLLLRLIPAFDTMFLAEKYVADEGIKLTIDSVRKALKDVGVEEIVTNGENFNPHLMEAVTIEEGEENKVLETMMPGYTLNGKLIRPAQVKVGKSASSN